MSILNFLPDFKVVEVNRSTGLVAGHVLALFSYEGVATVEKSGHDYLENGIIVGLNNDLSLGDFDPASHSQPLLVFTEELVTFLSGNKYYATMEDYEGDIIPRVIGLFVGDIFTTNNYDGTYNDEAFANVVNGVLTFTNTAVGALFAVEASTLATGEAAVRFTYIGLPLA